jgi:hypothetical protein
MNPSNYISEEKEIERYQEYYNSINHIGYQNFVSPILTKIQTSFKKTDSGSEEVALYDRFIR